MDDLIVRLSNCSGKWTAKMTKKIVHLVWLSFVDESGWLGGCIVEAQSLAVAVTKTHLLGINPGGEIASIEFDIANDAIPEAWPIDTLCRDKLAMKALPPPRELDL